MTRRAFTLPEPWVFPKPRAPRVPGSTLGTALGTALGVLRKDTTPRADLQGWVPSKPRAPRVGQNLHQEEEQMMSREELVDWLLIAVARYLAEGVG
jgi:hypothetical protein